MPKETRDGNHGILSEQVSERSETPSALVEISALKILSHYMGNHRTVETVLLPEKIVIALLELKKVVIEQLPQGTLLRFPSPVYFDLAAVFHTAPLLPTRELS
jgi:hypothetical protein